MRLPSVFAIAWLGAVVQLPSTPPRELPAPAAAALAASLNAARSHRSHIWRDTPHARGELVTGYIEIPLGERRKYEFDMRANRRRIDRVMPPDVGGYPINYGFVPQTVSYDGDPFDVLVLGPPLAGGSLVNGTIVGLMLMEDEKGLDSKVVISPADARGRPRYSLTADVQKRVAAYFAAYKRHEPGKFSRVPGWGSADDGRAHVERTHEFFLKCRAAKGACRL